MTNDRPVPHRYGRCENCGVTMDLEDGVPTLAPAPIAIDKKPGDLKECQPCQRIWPRG